VLLTWLRNWRSRHRNPTNFLLHMAGIPATILAVPLTVLGHWLLAGGVFLGGYALQFLGHIVEGNRSGEEELLRRILRRIRRK
jgi:uncharacterized membrane protein YGL010W